MKTELSFSCRGAAGVSAESATELCDDAIAVLREAHPNHGFRTDVSDPPGLLLTVTHANDRGAALEVVWLAANGSKRSGTPLRTAFFDKSSDQDLRRRFLRAFFQQNPLPF